MELIYFLLSTILKLIMTYIEYRGLFWIVCKILVSQLKCPAV